jgi:hypothetical protein
MIASDPDIFGRVDERNKWGAGQLPEAFQVPMCYKLQPWISRDCCYVQITC